MNEDGDESPIRDEHHPDPAARRFSVPGKLSLITLALLLVGAAAAAAATAAGAAPWLVLFTSLAVAVPLSLAAWSWMFRTPERVLQALEDGVQGFRAGDFSLRLAVERDDELGQMVAMYNEVSDTLRAERSAVRQRELLLEKALEASPAAIVLTNAVDRILFANREARTLVGGGHRLEGRALGDVAAASPPAFAAALRDRQEALVTLPVAGAEESFHLTHRAFELNAQRHHLVMVRHATPELRRQEMAAYKRVIRVINHELNNTLAPVSSLVHSAKLLAAKPDEKERIGDVFDTIDECVKRLHAYLDGYASFARLPSPRLRPVELPAFLEQLRELHRFELVGDVPPVRLLIDDAQIQSVLLNLLKNAREAGSPPDEIRLRVERTDGGGVAIAVLDRGRGMDPATFARAVVPFYSSKDKGTGLGLALSREILDAHGGRLTLAVRDGGGLAVTCWLPQARA